MKSRPEFFQRIGLARICSNEQFHKCRNHVTIKNCSFRRSNICDVIVIVIM